MAESILLLPDTDVTDVLVRLRRTRAREIRLVVPPRSALARSRFNFQLLASRAEEAGLDLEVESDDERVLQLARAAGLTVRAQGGVPTPAGAMAPAAGPPTEAAPPLEDGDYAEYAEYDDDEEEDGEYEEDEDDDEALVPAAARYQPRYGPWRPEQAGRPAPRSRYPEPARSRRRVPLYLAAVVILLIGVAAVVVLVPSATITLQASAQQFSTPVDLTAQPGAPANGITVRTQTVQKQFSGTFQATGQKNTPGAKATGTIQYQADCGPLGLQVAKGALLTSQSGTVFVQQKAVTIGSGQTKTAPIQAQAAGSSGNVAAGQITSLQNAGIYASCLKVTNPQATSGGQDAKHQAVITQQDLTSAQAQLDQQARSAIQSELAGDVRSGEKQSDQNTVAFGTPDFTADHAVGSAVDHFNATLTLQGSSAYYRPGQVSSAFWSALKAKVPAGRQLTPDDFVAQYQTTATGDGHLEFKGQATGRIAPRLDLGAIRSQLAGRSQSSADQYLHHLPVSGVQVDEYPFSMPILPFLSNRISVEYVIQQPAVSPPSQTPPAGATVH